MLKIMPPKNISNRKGSTIKQPTVSIIFEHDFDIKLNATNGLNKIDDRCKGNESNFKEPVSESQYNIEYPSSSQRNDGQPNNNSLNIFEKDSTNTTRSNSTPSIVVIREQYWSCPDPICRNCTRREKFLYSTIIILTVIVIGMTVIITYIWNDSSGQENLDVWFPWSF